MTVQTVRVLSARVSTRDTDGLFVFNDAAEKSNVMKVRLEIIEVENLSDHTLLVHFNDGTFSPFSVYELAALHPQRSLGEGENAEFGQESL